MDPPRNVLSAGSGGGGGGEEVAGEEEAVGGCPPGFAEVAPLSNGDPFPARTVWFAEGWGGDQAVWVRVDPALVVAVVVAKG